MVFLLLKQRKTKNDKKTFYRVFLSFLMYWCDDCNKKVPENCGHRGFNYNKWANYEDDYYGDGSWITENRLK